MKVRFVLFAAAVCLGAVRLVAEDVFCFRGKDSQGKYNEPGLLKTWPEGGLTPKWINTELGEGWSSVIKVGNRLYLNVLDAGGSKRESVLCLDLEGKKVWQTTAGACWSASYANPRSTPTYVPGDKAGEGCLVVFSSAGELYCLNAADGKVLWHKNLAAAYETKFGRWGLSESVAVRDGKAFVTVCGKKALAVALKLSDGTVAWEAPSNGDMCAYVSPVVHGNTLIVMTAQYVSGIDTADGKILWQGNYKQDALPNPRSPGINCNVPLVKGNRVFVTAGYDQGGVMYEILPDGKGVKKAWLSPALDPHHGGAVELDGRIYGSNWLNNNAGNWVCLDWETGKTVYEEPWDKLGKGVTVFADGMLYLYEEKRGTLALAKPGDTFSVVSSFPVTFGSKEHWSHPVISDGVLYVRRGTALAAYDIRQK